MDSSYSQNDKQYRQHSSHPKSSHNSYFKYNSRSHRSHNNFNNKNKSNFSHSEFPELNSSQHGTFEPEFQQARPIQNSQFQNLVQVVANRFGFGTTLKAIQICQFARELIKELLPQQVANISPLFFKDRIIVFISKSPSHSLLLVTKKHQLLEQLNMRFGSQTCTDIKIRLKSGSAND